MPHSLDAACAAARDAVAVAGRLLAERGMVVGTAGNLSVRLGDLVVVTATGARFEQLISDDVTVVDLAGAVVGGDLAPTSELDLHLGIYRSTGAGAIVHTHSPVAVAVGLVVDELPCVHYQMLLLGGSIRVAPYATFGTAQLAGSVVTALDGRSAALMANHGAVTHASTLNAAVEQALLLEWACTVYWRAASMGTPRSLDPDQQQAVMNAALSRSYGATQPAHPNTEDS